MSSPQLNWVLHRLAWMRKKSIWPNGLRYLWTDAFGLALYTSLYQETKDEQWRQAAEWLIKEVVRVLGRPKGFRIGEAPDRDGQYFHYLAMWMSALAVASVMLPQERERGIATAKAVHSAFVIPVSGESTPRAFNEAAALICKRLFFLLLT